MRVLVITLFYQNYNYGGILQAYALYRKLREMRHDVTELNYLTTEDNRVKRLTGRILRLLKGAAHPAEFLETQRKNHKIRVDKARYDERFPDDPMKRAFDSFMSREFHSTPLYHPDTISLLPKYDAYITGGDQMWNPLWFDRNYFLRFAEGKKIAYSCSVGKDTLTGNEKKALKELIGGIDCISTRESNICDWLIDEGLDCKLIADAVFLLTAEAWRRFAEAADAKVSLNESRYLFAYLLGEDEERRKAVRQFAERHGFKVVSISHVWRRYNEYDENFADYSYTDAGPEEFVKLISDASYVMTDSFHGTAFSILFNKPFYNFSRFSDGDEKSLNSRLRSLLLEYGLESRMVKIADIPKLDVSAVDYENVNRITRMRRERAFQYLEKSLSGI